MMIDRAKRLPAAGLAAGLILVLSSSAGAQTTGPAPAPVTPAAPAADASTVPAKTIRVQVLGAVSHPGNIDVAEGGRLLLALARAGVSVETRPDLSRVILVRANPDTGKAAPAYMIDVYRALRGGDRRFDPVLRADDKIYVPELRTGIRPIQVAAP